MMHEPMLMLALAILVISAAVLMFNGARKRRLKVKIEAVPAARLDNTPVRSEILSEVRVRERDDALRAESEHESVSEAPAATLAMPDQEPLTAALAVAVAEPEVIAAVEPVIVPTAVKLSQADLFPEDIHPPKVPAAADPVETSAPDLAIDRVMSVHVMANTQLINGRQLLELLLQYGLRYGDMQIFHRHEHPTGQGETLFSMAQAVEPGTFNIDTLERDLVPGVSFFMSLPGVKSTLAFDLMIDTARRLAHELQADLVDAQSQALTAATLEQWRDEVVAYERQQLQSQ
ncbi:MAG: cell division protein ZipA [Pseudomonadota bacterium]